MLSYIKVNDIFDELIDENKKLRECLKVFIEFKVCVDLYLKDITIASVVQLNKKIKELKLLRCLLNADGLPILACLGSSVGRAAP